MKRHALCLTVAMACGCWLAQAAVSAAQPGAEAASAGPIRCYVSPQGNDGWSGSLPEPNAGHSDGPFRTIARAQQAVRERLAGASPSMSVEVILRGGTYFQPKPLVFTPSDGGVQPRRANAPRRRRRGGGPFVTYQAFPGERPVVSGGRRITEWHTERLGERTAWTALLPEVAEGKWEFRELFVNGERRPRPRLPKEGYYRVAELVGQTWGSHYQSGTDKFIYENGDLRASWHNLQDVDVTVLAFWNTMHMKLKAVDEAQHLATLDRNSEWRMSDDFEPRGAEYFVEAIFEELNEPGQWYLDRPTGKLYYLPKAGEKPENTEVIAPYLAAVLQVEGSGEVPVQRLRFQGLTFSHTEWQLPADRAMPGAQGAVDLPGSVILRNAQDCEIEQCTFEHLGNYGVEIAEGCVENHVVGCSLHDLGGGGVKIDEGSLQSWVTDCEIYDIGRIFNAGMGVLICASSGNQVLHNHIHHLYQSGIQVGWNWSYGPSTACGNIIEYNHIHDFGQGMSSDMGGIYTLGCSPGTRIRYNVIHDGSHRGYGDQGIYLDQGSSDLLIEGNLIYNCESGFSENGRDNIFRNNIFALNRAAGLRPSLKATEPPHSVIRFEHNIVYHAGAELFWGGSREREEDPVPALAEFRENVYFSTAAGGPTFYGETLEEWQKAGHDAGSIVADPLFVDPAKGDFRLRPGSPALTLGFRPVDYSAVGPRLGLAPRPQ